jgi:DNA-binding transcriptional LysR family regulator
MSVAEGFEEFVTIVDSGSVTGAAERLGLPRPTLSRRLVRLEERLGVRLLHRTTRRMKLTPQGELLYAKARGVVLAARDAEAEVRRHDDVPRGLLRVSTPMNPPQGVFTRWITEFLSTYPEVSIELVASSVHVDLVAEGFDVALRGDTIEDSSLVARTLVHNRRVAVASPAYLEIHGVPGSADALADHNCILGFRGGSAPELRWPLRDGGSVSVAGTLMTNQMGIRLEAAKAHLGIALVIERFAGPDLASGALVPVLPDIVGRDERACLVYPDREFLDPKVRAFVDFIASRVQAAHAEA